MNLEIVFLTGVAFAWIIAPAVAVLIIALYDLLKGMFRNERMDSKR